MPAKPQGVNHAYCVNIMMKLAGKQIIARQKNI